MALPTPSGCVGSVGVVAQVVAEREGVGLEVVLSGEGGGAVVALVRLGGAVGDPGEGDLVVRTDDHQVLDRRVVGTDLVDHRGDGGDHGVGGVDRARVGVPGGVGALHAGVGVHRNDGAVHAGGASEATAWRSDMIWPSAACPKAAVSRWVSTRNRVLAPLGMATGPLTPRSSCEGAQVGDARRARRRRWRHRRCWPAAGTGSSWTRRCSRRPGRCRSRPSAEWSGCTGSGRRGCWRRPRAGPRPGE